MFNQSKDEQVAKKIRHGFLKESIQGFYDSFFRFAFLITALALIVVSNTSCEGKSDKGLKSNSNLSGKSALLGSCQSTPICAFNGRSKNCCGEYYGTTHHAKLICEHINTLGAEDNPTQLKTSFSREHCPKTNISFGCESNSTPQLADGGTLKMIVWHYQNSGVQDCLMNEKRISPP